MLRRLMAGFAFIAIIAMSVGAARADPLSDAKAGLDALNKGDNDTAIRLLSEAINSGGLASSDLELAHVKRAEAYAAEKNAASASIDLDAAAKLDPNDKEIATVRQQLQGSGPADSGPSLQETVQFILSKIQEYSSINFNTPTGNFAKSIANVTASDDLCNITWQEQDVPTSTINGNTTSTTFSYSGGFWFDRIKQPVSPSLETPAGWSPAVYDVGGIPIPDQEMAQRFANAVNHAVSLCQSRKEPF
jgi:tetratricopeptide (TPR) repeat protein